MSLKNRPTRYSSTNKPTLSIRSQYLSLLAKRPLLPADIHKLETLSLLLMHEESKNA